MKHPMSARAQVVAQQKYCRPKEDGSFETWPEVVDRVVGHQRWLWERAAKRPLLPTEVDELSLLRYILLERLGLLAGRTLWLGGTDTSKRRESSQFNCAGLHIETVHDFVDAFWLLLQGCGVGAQMVEGTLHGFPSPIPKVTIIHSTRTDKGPPDNVETYKDGVWTIKVGDSAEAWAKSVGKLLAGKYRHCKELVISGEQIRPAGSVIKGYGWLCHGDAKLLWAYSEVARILNVAAGKLLTAAQMHEIFNLLGTVLSSRRSAEIVTFDYPQPGWEEFISFKANHEELAWWKSQSNNTLNFYEQPRLTEIFGFLSMMQASGGSEPGIRNAARAKEKAPWCRITNPCAEILLPNKGFCNLVTINLKHPKHQSPWVLYQTAWCLARANYRQTCVNLRDGVLQSAWHENNENLRLCGVSLTGWLDNPLPLQSLRLLKSVVQEAVDGMADALDLPRAKAATTIKPEGTASKILDCKEGMHDSVGRFILNNINFSKLDNRVAKLVEAGYRVRDNPIDSSSVLISFPIDNGPATNPKESAISQLDRYLFLLEYWADHNVSATIYYNPDEIPEIGKWLYQNWNRYVSVSFLPRQSKGEYAYRPQEVITEEEYAEYASTLRPVDLTVSTVDPTLDESEADCATGACPAR